MSRWRKATDSEFRAWHGGYPMGNLVVRETEHGLEVIDSTAYANAMTRAELTYTQSLWYAWGRCDSGEYSQEVRERLEVFEFARTQKEACMAFELGDTFYLESIQGSWVKYVKSKS